MTGKTSYGRWCQTIYGQYLPNCNQLRMIQITDDLRTARAIALLEFLDRGAGFAKIMVFTGPRAVLVTDIPPLASTMMVELILKKPSGSINQGFLLLEQAQSNMVMATGEPTWARVVNGEGVTAFDCDAGGPAVLGTWELKMSQDVLYAGGYALLSETRIR